MRILVISGSIRAASFNYRLATLAAHRLSAQGANVTLLPREQHVLPFMDQDLEIDGLPAPVRALRKVFAEHDALIIASPEYNGSITPLLKNLLDWVSRNDEAAPGVKPYQNKLAAILSASPGGLGGIRAHRHVRDILDSLGVAVVPPAVGIGKAMQAFDDEGALKDATQAAQIDGLLNKLQEWSGRLKR